MNMLANFAHRFFEEDRASVLIETAFVAPALVGLTLGGVEAGAMYARQTQLQQIASNSMEIVLTSAPTTELEGAATLNQVRAYAAEASGLTATTSSEPAVGQVAVYKRYRCGNNSARQATYGCSNESQSISTFVVIYLRTSYSPVWTNYGIGQDFEFNVKRSVQIG
ncbi:TadE/TadG family type IV pilus assembly protein [Croceicoccus bisphenolivorans]|uniref:TadE/TadG family type IV pilus assembly protein n=1 Tax=Croceicoccus bisphenolivorans TaxID=1783232 RepID=UPI00082FA796|nr:TadE/TadG family type IV pilus assembly protein [Croceicoccus bisphenolivorans]